MKYKMHPKMKAKLESYKARKLKTRQPVTLEDLVRAAHNAGATISLSLVPMRIKVVKQKKKKQPIVYGKH